VIGDDIISVKSDVHQDGKWRLETPDGRVAQGQADSAPEAHAAISAQLDAWYPDNEGETTIVRLVP
jgi:hypothetical protein